MNSTIIDPNVQQVLDGEDRKPIQHRFRKITGGYAVIWWTTAALLIVGSLSGALTIPSLTSLLPFASILAIAAVGQTLVVQQRGLDFSVAGIFSLATVISTVVPATFGLGDISGIVAALVVSAATGLLTGIAVTRLRITPLIATLGVNALLLGLCRTMSGSSTTRASDGLTELVNGRFLGIPTIGVIAAVIIGGAAVLTSHTVPGRKFVIVGASPAAARATGIPLHRYQVGAYILAGLCYGLAGILFAGYVNTPPIDSGNSYLLATVTAVVIGGTPLSGGKASITASAVGALFISVLSQIVLALGAPSSVQLLLQGLAIALAMLVRAAAALTWGKRSGS
ncbi:ABC transporter permease [Arthrobacter globiformis]|uniref:ABC transporter permease n=1 Tax=Arthrobacter globiformis TaxID=1665 RepID=UPI002785A331|nr:ABC transporter permease [Arthrobacter globiformis]MDQ0867295.1 ribose transport system permease protein [Arthrobacter globiformis]